MKAGDRGPPTSCGRAAIARGLLAELPRRNVRNKLDGTRPRGGGYGGQLLGMRHRRREAIVPGLLPWTPAEDEPWRELVADSRGQPEARRPRSRVAHMRRAFLTTGAGTATPGLRK